MSFQIMRISIAKKQQFYRTKKTILKNQLRWYWCLTKTIFEISLLVQATT